MENIQIAKTFEEVADLLEIQGANPFRVRAYRNAARTIGTLGTPVETILKHNSQALQELPGIGADLAGKIARMCRTGEFALLRQLTRKTPESLTDWMSPAAFGGERRRWAMSISLSRRVIRRRLPRLSSRTTMSSR
jgi:DNA polymerase (family 10)